MTALHAVPTPAPTTATDYREIGDEFWHRGETTGGAWVRIPPAEIAQLVEYLRQVVA